LFISIAAVLTQVLFVLSAVVVVAVTVVLTCVVVPHVEVDIRVRYFVVASLLHVWTHKRLGFAVGVGHLLEVVNTHILDLPQAQIDALVRSGRHYLCVRQRILIHKQFLFCQFLRHVANQWFKSLEIQNSLLVAMQLHYPKELLEFIIDGCTL